FEMGSQPNMEWGADSSAQPPTHNYDKKVDNVIEHNKLIDSRSTWKYFDKGEYPGEGWTDLDFDDSSWDSGPGILGYDKYGHADTVVSYGPDSGNKYPTTYFRKTFNATD